MSVEEPSARRRKAFLRRQRAGQIEHVEPALEGADERAQPVVGGHQLARLGDRLQREPIFARHLRDIAQVDGQQLAVGRGLHGLLGDDLHLARGRLEEHADGDGTFT